MALRYFKCVCGHEQRKSVATDRTNYRQLPNGAWRFDPSLKQVEVLPTSECESCGLVIQVSDDPAAVKSFFKFNFFE